MSSVWMEITTYFIKGSAKDEVSESLHKMQKVNIMKGED